MSNHGYLKPGQWIQITRDINITDIFIGTRSIIPKGTYVKYDGSIGDMMLFTSSTYRFKSYRSDIRYKAISPKKSSTLEALYGNKT